MTQMWKSVLSNTIIRVYKDKYTNETQYSPEADLCEKYILVYTWNLVDNKGKFLNQGKH